MDRLDAAEASAKGQLLRRASEILTALRLGVNVSLDEIPADEFVAMLLIEREQLRFEQERMKRHGG